MNKNMINKIFSLAFCVCLIAFSAFNAFKPQGDFSENENRFLKKIPKFAVQKLVKGEFSGEFETFTTDQFFKRDFFVSSKAYMERSLGKRENNGVYFGRDNFLIQIPEGGNEKYIENNINAINDLASLGKYSINVCIVPTAFEVMEEWLPPYAYNDIQIKMMERAKAELVENVNFITPQRLMSGDAKKQIYYRTDHHYTTFGAYLAYTDIAKGMGLEQIYYEDNGDYNVETLTRDFYGTTWSKATIKSIPPDEILAFSLKEGREFKVEFVGEGGEMEGLYSYDKLATKDKYSVFLDGNHSLVKITSSQKNGKKLMVIKDSYAHALVPFLANHYEEIYMLDMRYFNGDTQKLIDSYKLLDILFLYNVENFTTDNNLIKISAFIK